MDKENFRGVTSRGNSIQIAFTYQGIRCRETIRVQPTKTALKEASRRKQAIAYSISNGTFSYEEFFPNSKKAKKFRSSNPKICTVGESLINWLTCHQTRLQKSTRQDYSSAIHYHLIPAFSKLTIAEITPRMIKEWLNTLTISNKRKNNILIPLRQVFEELYLDEVIDKNPLDRVKNLPVQTREANPFTPEEITGILNQLHGQERNLIQFAFWTGLRTSELIALQWENVDLDQDRLFVTCAHVRRELKETKTKSGKREVHLQPQAREALLDQLMYTKGNGYVFFDPLNNTPWKSDQPIRRRVWIPALRKAGIEYREPYQTRHTFASTLLSRGDQPMWVAQQMGHKDWGQIRKVYGRWIPSPAIGPILLSETARITP